MCQQWISIAGLCADIVGFLMIVKEWQFGWSVYLNERRLEISELYQKRFLRSTGQETRTDYEKEGENPSLPKHMEMGLSEEAKYRTKVFYSGVSLVILGFLLQVAGDLPGGITFLHVESCSKALF